MHVCSLRLGGYLLPAGLAAFLFAQAPVGYGQIDVTQPGDYIVAVNGTNDGDPSAGPPPTLEGPERAIDNQGQKYLNFLDLGSGIVVSPYFVGLTVVTGLRFYTANDEISRDPASYVLEGGPLEGPWTVISSGPLALPDARNPGGDTPLGTALQEVTFPNPTPHAAYRLTFPTLKNAAVANSMQIGEVELLGVPYAPGFSSFAADFTTGLPAGSALFSIGDPPQASVVGGVLHLTEASSGQNNMFVVEDFNQGQAVASFDATFKVRLGNVSPLGPADGFSFSFGPDIDPASFAGEEGSGSGLRVTFDTWDNGPLNPGDPISDFDAPSIEVVYNNQRRATVSMAGNRFEGRPPATPIPLDPNTGDPMSLVTGDAFVNVHIRLHANGALEVRFNNVTVLTAFTDYSPTAGRFALAARTGGAWTTHHIDDLLITVATSALEVTNNNDSGNGSLRQAIFSANASQNTKVITFNLPNPAARTIALSSPLPPITASVTLDASSAPGFTLNGAGAGAGANGLVVSASKVVLRGLGIHRFSGHGILLSNSIGCVIERCLIGTDAAGATGLGNGGDGIRLLHSSNTSIGGPQAGNVIARNGQSGIRVRADPIPAFSVRLAYGLGFVDSIADAEAALASPQVQRREVAPTVNYLQGLFDGRFTGNRPFPGLSLAGDDSDFAVEAIGILTIPTAGIWSFGVNSADGFEVRMGLNSFACDCFRGPSDTISAFNLPAGDHLVRLVYFKSFGGGTHVEFFAAPGNRPVFDSSFRLVGDTANGGLPVRIATASTNNSIRFNSIYANGQLGIDLGPDGVNANDATDNDTGPNGLQNFPVLVSYTPTASGAFVQGTFISRPSTSSVLDFYASAQCDSSGQGEGQQHVGSVIVRTEANGGASFWTATLPLPTGTTVLTATATDPDGNTSEFSPCGMALPSDGCAWATDFSSGFPAGASAHALSGPPAPAVVEGVLRLTEATTDQNNMFLIDDFNQGRPVEAFGVRFKARLGELSPAGPADGFSLSFGPDISTSSFAGEEGVGSGLRVTFDTWDNGPLNPDDPISDFDAPSIEIVYNNQRRGTVSMAGNRFNGRAPATPIPTDPATGQPMTLVTGTAFADVEVRLDSDGTVDVSYKGAKVFENVPTGYMPTAGRFALTARTAGAWTTHYIDDLSIACTVRPGPPEIASQPVDAVVFEPSAVSFSVTATGAAPLTYQWRRNGNNLAGANGSTYQLASTSRAADNNAQFSVVISNSSGSVTSQVATLTVNAAPAFTTSGLALWLRADAGVQASNSEVTQWNDQSANKRPAVQGSAASRPSLVSGVLNGEPAIRFDGLNDFLTFNLPVNGLGGMTVVLVAASRQSPALGSTQAEHAALFWNETAAWGTLHVSPFQQAVALRFGTGQPGNRILYSRPSSVGSSFTLTTALKSGSTDSLYVNRVLVLSEGGKLPAIAGCRDTGNLGRGHNDNTFYPGDMAEVLIYTRALNDPERELVENYLAAKYRLETLAPPPLDIQLLGNGNVRVYWPLPATGFMLYQTPALSSPASAIQWSLVPPATYQTDALYRSITVQPTGNRFYRLQWP